MMLSGPIFIEVRFFMMFTLENAIAILLEGKSSRLSNFNHSVSGVVKGSSCTIFSSIVFFTVLNITISSANCKIGYAFPQYQFDVVCVDIK